MMISVHEATQIIRDSASRLAPQRLPVDQILELELADDVISPINVPAFRKSMMDGVAVRCADFDGNRDSFHVQSTIAAGDVPDAELKPGHVSRIMTGASLPPGADAVVPHEELAEAIPDWRHATTVRFQQPPRPRQNMMEAGEIVAVDDTVLTEGTIVSPATQAFLMELGLRNVLVYPKVMAAVVASGSELVDWPAEPQPGSIRNTNGPMLTALLREFGCAAENLGNIADDEALLREKLNQGLDTNLLVVTGGVSVGDLDLVPAMLQRLQVRQQFHGVAIKPGQPIWFGMRNETYVFGLPGNPVSALVGFHIFIRPLLSRLTGRNDGTDWTEWPLAEPYSFVGRRETYLPARLGEGRVQILPWQGSSDLRTLAIATGLVRFPIGNAGYSTGDRVPYLAMSSVRHGDT